MIVSDADREAVAGAAAARGLDLEAVREDASGATWAVTVVVDADGGVPLDTLAALSRDLDHMAESWGGPDRPVTLEVTSRGVDAPLREVRHWRRARGRQVDLEYVDGSDGPDRARVGDVDEPARTVRLVSRSGRGPVVTNVSLDAVERAVVRVEFSPAPAAELDLLSEPSEE